MRSIEAAMVHSIPDSAPVNKAAFSDPGIQVGPQRPSYTLERSDIDGLPVHRCECGKRIKRMSDLKRHWNSRRHGGRGFGCLRCRRSYSRSYLLDRHVCRARLATTSDAMEVDTRELYSLDILILLTKASISPFFLTDFFKY